MQITLVGNLLEDADTLVWIQRENAKMTKNLPKTPDNQADVQKERREFLRRCGRFAAVTPPAMTMLLALTEIPKEAHASTIGHGNSGKTPPGNAWGWYKP